MRLTGPEPLIKADDARYNCIRMKKNRKVSGLILLCLGLALCVLARGLFCFSRDSEKDVMLMAVLSEETGEEKKDAPLFVERRFMAAAPVSDSQRGLRIFLFGLIVMLFFFIHNNEVSSGCTFFCPRDRRFFKKPLIARFLGGRGPPPVLLEQVVFLHYN
jgi:hypothetical protein